MTFIGDDYSHPPAACQPPAFAGQMLQRSFCSTFFFREDIMRLARVGLATAFAAILLGASPFGTGAQAADPIKIRLSYVVPIANWASMLVEKKDLARNLDKSYKLEITRFAGTPPMIT